MKSHINWKRCFVTCHHKRQEDNRKYTWQVSSMDYKIRCLKQKQNLGFNIFLSFDILLEFVSLSLFGDIFLFILCGQKKRGGNADGPSFYLLLEKNLNRMTLHFVSVTIRQRNCRGSIGLNLYKYVLFNFFNQFWLMQSFHQSELIEKLQRRQHSWF